MIFVFIKMNAKPEKRKEGWQTIRPIVERMRTENGCLHSNFYQIGENENGFLMIDECETRKDVDEHLRSDMFIVLMGPKSLLSRPPEITINTVSHSSGLESTERLKD